ncbi:MAG: DUF503 domain-containing protein [SAR202 cluster bacterium]|nr:DUF503 domain-containing protein [SAR202 cluster bacterium]
MHIGVCRLTFHLECDDSLKGKRQVAQSLIGRVRRRFNGSIAEVDAIDRHQTLVLGIACASGNSAYVGEQLDAIVKFVYAQHVDAELIEVEREVMEVL